MPFRGFCKQCAARLVGRALLVSIAVILAPDASSEVFYAKDEALELAFPEADNVEMKTFILTEDELARAEKMAKVKIDSKLITFYEGIKDGQLLGYACIDTHVVRTLPETFMVVMNPEGEVERVTVLAFHEPQEHLPSARWYEQFRGERLSPELWPGRKIAGILGSTLSVRAITSGVRKVLAIFQIAVIEKKTRE
ncbi:MAG: FMN-binding protein [Deltaproteobacteria bacterium]|nr:FMN-binding protein [Deltaproteobacteria bacterium]